MENVITIGKRLLPLEQVVFVEAYDPSTNQRLQTNRDYKARLVLINRDSVLIEDLPAAFAATHGFRMLEADQVATNPRVAFRVETFEPAQGFTPSKPFATRLLWRDQDGNDQSKLLLASPERVLAVVLRGTSDAEGRGAPPAMAEPDESARRRSPRRRSAAGADPLPPQ